MPDSTESDREIADQQLGESIVQAAVQLNGGRKRYSDAILGAAAYRVVTTHTAALAAPSRRALIDAMCNVIDRRISRWDAETRRSLGYTTPYAHTLRHELAEKIMSDVIDGHILIEKQT